MRGVMIMKEWILGIDVQTQYTTYCYYDEEQNEAVEVADTNPISNAVFYAEQDNQWYFAQAAVNAAKEQAGIFIEDILEGTLLEKICVTAQGKKVSYQELFANLIKQQLMDCFGEMFLPIKQMVITMRHPNYAMVDACQKIAEVLQISKSQIVVMSYQMAAVHFVLKQDTSIWNNGVAIMEYTKSGMRLSRILPQMRSRLLQLHFMQEKLEGMPSLLQHPAPEEKDAALQVLCKETFTGKERNVSGIYLLGEGFQEEFIQHSANALCRGRRVFVGQNLYASGACMAAFHGMELTDGKNTVILYGEQMVHYDIGVKVRYRGKDEIAPIILGEKEWFHAKGSVCVFLNETTQLEIDFIHRVTKDIIREVIEIEGLPKRPPRTTKLQIQVKYLDANRGEIVIRDKGFGAMYPSTEKVFRKEFAING